MKFFIHDLRMWSKVWNIADGMNNGRDNAANYIKQYTQWNIILSLRDMIHFLNIVYDIPK